MRPPGDERLPGVVVVHEIFGPDDVNKRSADRMAALGYSVVMPDLFSEGGPRKCLKATFQALQSGHGRAYQDIAAARQWLLDRDDTSDDIGIIGFCMGGGFALMCAAPSARVPGAARSTTAMLPSSPEVLEGACPIVASYGARDTRQREGAGQAGVPPDPARRAARRRSSTRTPGTRSSTTPTSGRGGLAAGVPARRHVGPEPESAADAWQRIDAFFGAHLPR